MSITKHQQNHNDFTENPLAHLFYQFIDDLKSRRFYQEAKDLLVVAQHHYLPENRNIITKIITEMQKTAFSEQINKFTHLLQKI